MRQLQRTLSLSARKSQTRRFQALDERLYDWEMVQEAWKRVRANQGAAGIDGQTRKAIEAQGIEPFLREIQQYLRQGRDHPMPVRRVKIPKPDGRKRPLGIPTVRDRVVQAAAKLVLEPVFEADVKESSCGFRPRRGALEAMERIRLLANRGFNYVLDADIRDFFGSIDHGKLLEAVQRRVSDRRMVQLIGKWLKAGVLVEGRREESLTGTPQGGVISPLLANLYLHHLDERWETEGATLGVLTRYADDVVVLAKTRRALEEARRRIAQILQGLRLELQEAKTQEVELTWGKEGFCFLGWYVRTCPSARYPGKYYLNRWPSPKSMKRLCAKLRQLIHRNRRVRGVRDLVPELNPLLRGWANYFRTGNSRRKCEQVDKRLWERLVRFENRRRRRTPPSWHPGRYDAAWFKGLGLFDLVQPGVIRYPGLVASHA